MTTRRKFINLAIAACAALGLFGFPRKRFVIKTDFDGLVGLRFEASDVFSQREGEWEIYKRCPPTFEWRGELLDNMFVNKYLARPVSESGPVECISFIGDLKEYGKVNLEGCSFWRV